MSATIVGPRKSPEQLKREREIYLMEREKEGVLRRLQRKAPGVVWDETHAIVPAPGPKGSTIVRKVTLPAGWQSDVKGLTIQSIIKMTREKDSK
jgi:hypothetical protein